MNPEVEKVMGSKRLLLFGELLEMVDFPCRRELLHYLTAGFPVVGNFLATGISPPAKRVAELSLEDLWRSGRRDAGDTSVLAPPLR